MQFVRGSLPMWVGGVRPIRAFFGMGKSFETGTSLTLVLPARLYSGVVERPHR